MDKHRSHLIFPRTLLPLLLVVLLLAGCVHTSVTRLGSETYPPTSPDAVVIYLSEDDVPGPYEKIALINAKGESSWTNERQMLRKVREEAARLGANGVLLKGIDEPSAGAKIAGAFLGTGSQRTGRMVAIYVRAEAAPRQKEDEALGIEKKNY